MTDDNTFELSRRKALAGIGSIGVATAGAGLGTSAYFSDQESFEGNSLAAGELDLRIDWQQKYYGMADGHDMAPYGSAGRPFVNAHPDHDMSGEQSLDTADHETLPNKGVVSYSDNDANIQEYLNCETLSNFGDPGDFQNDQYEDGFDSLIDLDDVKPGDCGEVTFSYHLCDNPGYVWLLGQAERMPKPLADALEVRMWYDLNCSNEVDPEDQVIFEWGSMSEVFGSELDGNVQLTPQYYDPDVAAPEETGGAVECPRLGQAEWDGSQFVHEDGTDPIDTGTEMINGTENDYFTVEFFVGGDSVPVRLIVREYDNGDPQKIRFRLENEGGDEVVEGFCLFEVSGDGVTNNFANGPLCYRNVSNVEIQGNGSPSIEEISFYYCPSGTPEPNLCFPGDETFCLGFEWCLPADVDVDEIDGIDDINDLQGQSFSFDLGFYTEQCRHNDNPTGPPTSGA